jgi:formylglycine-generating enzyme required for sulfatase activity
VPGTNIRLGKYLVTVEEFARFIEEGGYRRDECWVDEDGGSFRRRNDGETPGSWDDQLKTPNRPVVEVSWFEAMAYCRWLGAEHPHLHIRLPTEAEWMAAASPDGRRYPWGAAEPDALRANFGQRVNAPTPVGIYPAGDGEFGHSDLPGNVWEWSLDAEKDIEFTAEQLQNWGRPRILCGGGYWGDNGGVTATVRLGLRSVDRDDLRGFRVAAEPASR